MSHHPDNLKLQPYPHDAVVELAEKAKALGIQFKINGIPFGAPYDRALWRKFDGEQGNVSGLQSPIQDGLTKAALGGGLSVPAGAALGCCARSTGADTL